MVSSRSQLNDIEQFEKDVKLRFRTNLLTEVQLEQVITTQVLTLRELRSLVMKDELEVRSFNR